MHLSKQEVTKAVSLAEYCINRKEGNDQESIQLPNTFRSKILKGKKHALKATAPQSKHYKQKAKRMVSFPKIGQTVIQNKKKITRTYMQRHTNTERVNNSRITALDRSVKYNWGWGLNRFYVATTLALISAVVYTRHLFRPREGLLTH